MNSNQQNNLSRNERIEITDSEELVEMIIDFLDDQMFSDDDRLNWLMNEFELSVPPEKK
ncbi:hypothetical protein [Bacillus sp. 2205SS5-2]|uniref:hypothetical protein n=1 Tax=Bacillus sp. 2205SS5-2 TaxID=3109031 RepID=UPI003005C38B